MAEHKVFCVKLKKELPGLDEPPFDTELGQKVYDNVSLEAWKGWTEFCKMLLNEYRLNPARREDQDSDRQADGAILLRRRRSPAQRVRAASREISTVNQIMWHERVRAYILTPHCPVFCAIFITP